MYNNNETKQAPTMLQIRRDFVFRIMNLEMSKDQFTIVEDLPITKPIRSEKKVSERTKGTYEVFHIKISVNNYEGELELMSRELQKIALAMPASLSNYKGAVLAYDGSHWQYICSDMPTPAATPIQPTQVLDQKDMYVEQLVQAMKQNDAANKGCSINDLMNYCKSITSGNALDLIMYARTKGAIYEQNGAYKAA